MGIVPPPPLDHPEFEKIMLDRIRRLQRQRVICIAFTFLLAVTLFAHVLVGCFRRFCE